MAEAFTESTPEYYREQARLVRDWAARVTAEGIRGPLEMVARQFDRLAVQGEVTSKLGR
jgi:hypothetical protein